MRAVPKQSTGRSHPLRQSQGKGSPSASPSNIPRLDIPPPLQAYTDIFYAQYLSMDYLYLSSPQSIPSSPYTIPSISISPLPPSSPPHRSMNIPGQYTIYMHTPLTAEDDPIPYRPMQSTDHTDPVPITLDRGSREERDSGLKDRIFHRLSTDPSVHSSLEDYLSAHSVRHLFPNPK